MIYAYEFKYWAGHVRDSDPSSNENGGNSVSSWLLTSTEYTDLISNGNTRSTVVPGLSHSSVAYNSEQNAGTITMTMPREHAVAQLFKNGAPTGSVYMRIFEMPDGVTNGYVVGFGSPGSLIWAGRVKSCKFSEYLAELSGTDGREKFARLGLRFNAGSQCQHTFGSTECGARPEEVLTTVSDISADGVTITVSASLANDYARAGYLIFGVLKKQVLSNVGGVLTLLTPLPSLTVGTSVSVTTGCNKTASSTLGCRKYDNYSNYSGFEGFPTPANPYAEGAK